MQILVCKSLWFRISLKHNCPTAPIGEYRSIEDQVDFSMSQTKSVANRVSETTPSGQEGQRWATKQVDDREG